MQQIRPWVFLAVLATSMTAFAQPLPSQAVPKRVLAEEFTGAWCGPCVRNALITRELLEEFGGAVIPVNIHSSTMFDSMAIAEGDKIKEYFFPNAGVPHSMVDRTHDDAATRLAQPAAVRVEIERDYEPATRAIHATITALFPDGLAATGLAINLYVIEDSVVGSGSGYNQVNEENTDPASPFYMAGNTIKGYAHRFVLRAVLSGVKGTQGVIPAYPEPGTGYTQAYDYILPSRFDERRISLVAFVSRPIGDWTKSSTEVLNASTIPLLGAASGLPAEQRPQLPLSVSPMPIAGRGTVNITLPAAGRVTLGLFDRMGRRVMLIADAPMRSGTTTLPLDLAALPTGVYELTASLDGRLLARRPVIALR